MTIDHLMRAVRHAAAANGSGALSSGEAITAALVLNRADWLADMGYTIGQALDRIDEGDVELIPRAENCGAPNARATPKSRQLPPALPKWRICSATRQVMSRTIPCTSIPSSSLMGTLRGYRHVYLVFDVSVVGRAVPEKKHRIELRVRAADGDPIVSHIMGVHRFAWSDGNRPIDAAEGERRPTWIDRIR